MSLWFFRCCFFFFSQDYYGPEHLTVAQKEPEFTLVFAEFA